MAGELAASQRKLERSRARSRAQEPAARRAPPVHRDGPRAHRDRRRLARRRRANRDDQRRGAAPARGRPRGHRRARPRTSARREDLQPLEALLAQRVRGGPASPPRRKSRWLREGRELHLAAAATPLQGDDGSAGGAVLVFDDVTPLIRTQRVAAWRDVARRLAHEIKNPLTPIQLCAERMRRQFSSAPRRRRARSSRSARRRSSARSSRSRRSSTSSRSSRGCRRRARCRPT